MCGADGGPAGGGVVFDALQDEAEVAVFDVIGFGEAGFEHVAFAGVEPELAVQAAAGFEAQRFALEARFGAGDPSACAQLRAWRGETATAFTWLEKALAARDPYMASLKSDLYLTSLHADPRWNALLKKIGLPTD